MNEDTNGTAETETETEAPETAEAPEASEAKPQTKAQKAAAAKREAEKKAKAKEKKAADSAFLKSADQVARRAAAELKKAEVAEGRADDLRLTAAVELAGLETQFKAANTSKWGKDFKGYLTDAGVVDAAVKGRGWENIRKLLAVGRAEDPRQALEDMRYGQRERMAASRARSKAKQANDAAQASSSGGSSSAAKTMTANDIIKAARAVSDWETRVTIARAIARDIGARLAWPNYETETFEAETDDAAGDNAPSATMTDEEKAALGISDEATMPEEDAA